MAGQSKGSRETVGDNENLSSTKPHCKECYNCRASPLAAWYQHFDSKDNSFMRQEITNSMTDFPREAVSVGAKGIHDDWKYKIHDVLIFSSHRLRKI